MFNLIRSFFLMAALVLDSSGQADFFYDKVNNYTDLTILYGQKILIFQHMIGFVSSRSVI